MKIMLSSKNNKNKSLVLISTLLEKETNFCECVALD